MQRDICLSMIVRNEEHCIQKCLESVRPLISSWVICDTGSTDGTEKITKECLKNISGNYVHSVWSDFATNRNIALDLAKQKAEFVLIIDADDSLVINDIHEFNNLTKNFYQIQIRHGSISYFRPQIVKSSIHSEYKGILHEFLEVLPPGGMIKNSYIHFGASGSRSKNPNKYLEDAAILEKALLKEPNNLRYMFYLAQSYRDAGDKEQAITNYLKRAKAGGWQEEVYVSYLEAGKLLEYIEPSKVEKTYLSACNILPTRNEALYYLARFHRSQNNFERAYFYASAARNILKPTKALFLEDACYSWKPLDEMAIAGYYIGKKKEAIKINQALLKDKSIPGKDLLRIQQNLLLCVVD